MLAVGMPNLIEQCQRQSQVLVEKGKDEMGWSGVEWVSAQGPIRRGVSPRSQANRKEFRRGSQRQGMERIRRKDRHSSSSRLRPSM